MMNAESEIHHSAVCIHHFPLACGAFTILELVLVLVILAITLAVSAPSLSRFAHGQELRGQAEDFVGAAQYARTQAVTQAKLYRINIDTMKGEYWVQVQNGDDFEDVPSPRWSKHTQVTKISFTKGTTTPTASALNSAPITKTPTTPTSDTSITFYPTGRAETCRVTFTDSRGESIDVACDSPTEAFHVVTQGGAS